MLANNKWSAWGSFVFEILGGDTLGGPLRATCCTCKSACKPRRAPSEPPATGQPAAAAATATTADVIETAGAIMYRFRHRPARGANLPAASQSSGGGFAWPASQWPSGATSGPPRVGSDLWPAARAMVVAGRGQQVVVEIARFCSSAALEGPANPRPRICRFQRPAAEANKGHERRQPVDRSLGRPPPRRGSSGVRRPDLAATCGSAPGPGFQLVARVGGAAEAPISHDRDRAEQTQWIESGGQIGSAPSRLRLGRSAQFVGPEAKSIISPRRPLPRPR